MWARRSASATGPRLDYNFNDKVFAIQNGLMESLTAPMLLARVREAESRSTEPYRLSEHMDRMTKAIWGEVGGGTAAAMQGAGRAGHAPRACSARTWTGWRR